jgi:ankyrin repeat protein
MSVELLEEYIETGNGPAIEDLLHSNPRLAYERTSHDMSPLLLACYYNKPILVKILLRKLDRLTIYEASAVGFIEDIMLMIDQDPALVNKVSDHGFTPIGIATHFGHEDLVRYLLTQHADPNLPSQNGFSVFPIHTAVTNGHLAIFKLLVEGGAEVNVLQASRISPLHLAAQKGNIELIILLLENGARIDLKNDNDQSAADLAFERGYKEIAEILKV